MDHEGDTMEGCVPSNRIDQFRQHLKEGSVYTFEDFIVADARKKYKTTDYPEESKLLSAKKSSKLSHRQIFSLSLHT